VSFFGGAIFVLCVEEREGIVLPKSIWLSTKPAWWNAMEEDSARVRPNCRLRANETTTPARSTPPTLHLTPGSSAFTTTRPCSAADQRIIHHDIRSRQSSTVQSCLVTGPPITWQPFCTSTESASSLTDRDYGIHNHQSCPGINKMTVIQRFTLRAQDEASTPTVL
jgi:hypothetical protein